MTQYRDAAKKRRTEEQNELSAKYDRAWSIANQAALILREQYGVHRIAVFGSLTQRQMYHQRSDVDLAVWELPDKDYYRAVARLLYLDPRHKIDLIRIEDVSGALKNHIEKEGIEL